MPHKRAKRSVREKKRTESGGDLKPGGKNSIENEEIPKGAARILNAAKVQQEYAEKKRKGLLEDGAGPSRKKRKTDGKEGEKARASSNSHLRIQPGESISHFNRRVEDAMRHSVREAMQISSAKMRKARKEELEQKAAPSASKRRSRSRSHGGSDDEASDAEDEKPHKSARKPVAAKDDKPKDFEKISTSAPRRLNDVVQAPPELKKLPRKAKKLAEQGAAKKGDGAKTLREGVLSMAQQAMMEEERERAIRLYRELKRGKTAA
ncbi:hypothetical protein PYCCODRAFT_1363116 [Trametes coccinea BRFM310]|uniref:Uncharacterized protein n=1 Tax=Trametes coccinea (strain BRFM310) TaxID=1353009 RepID=A0A1Y2IUU3_TRAC3|nr:hypothetical protein PYCCODRAFT_1363116 [Trametes coccinea BRFM310]